MDNYDYGETTVCKSKIVNTCLTLVLYISEAQCLHPNMHQCEPNFNDSNAQIPRKVISGKEWVIIF